MIETNRVTSYLLLIGVSLLLTIPVSVAAADPPAAETPASAVPTGNFLNSLKQAFRQDFDREVVRAHFDVGTPPDTHRYYCLIPQNRQI